jgi:hypothetical protein
MKLRRQRPTSIDINRLWRFRPRKIERNKAMARGPARWW